MTTTFKIRQALNQINLSCGVPHMTGYAHVYTVRCKDSNQVVGAIEILEGLGLVCATQGFKVVATLAV